MLETDALGVALVPPGAANAVAGGTPAYPTLTWDDGTNGEYFYRLVAIDRSTNISQLSARALARSVDTTPPAQPLWDANPLSRGSDADGSFVRVRFAPPTGDAEVRFRVQRRETGSAFWRPDSLSSRAVCWYHRARVSLAGRRTGGPMAQGSGWVVNGKLVKPRNGLRVSNYLDRPEVKLAVGQGLDGTDLGANRGQSHDVRMIILHTTMGDVATELRDGFGPSADDGEHCARFWSTSNRQSGAHVVVDRDGDVHCLCDLGRVAAWHAGQGDVNRNSIGIEIYQDHGPGRALWVDQLGVAVAVVDDLTQIFGIQRQIPRAYYDKPLARLESGGRDCVGVFGHRDVSNNRGRGDPGDQIMDALRAANYLEFDFAAGEDRDFWRDRQRELGIGVDGIPYIKTVAALIRAGHAYGQWVHRPLPPADPPSSDT